MAYILLGKSQLMAHWSWKTVHFRALTTLDSGTCEMKFCSHYIGHMAGDRQASFRQVRCSSTVSQLWQTVSWDFQCVILTTWQASMSSTNQSAVLKGSHKNLLLLDDVFTSEARDWGQNGYICDARIHPSCECMLSSNGKVQGWCRIQGDGPMNTTPARLPGISSTKNVMHIHMAHWHSNDSWDTLVLIFCSSFSFQNSSVAMTILCDTSNFHTSDNNRNSFLIAACPSQAPTEGFRPYNYAGPTCKYDRSQK